MENIKICLICGLSNVETKFQPSRKYCIKWNSRKCNEKLGNEYYNNIMKARYVKHGQVGRPKKIVSDDEVKIKRPRGRPKNILII